MKQPWAGAGERPKPGPLQKPLRNEDFRILVVEDEAAWRELVCEELLRLGFRVLHAFDGQAALDSMARNRVDLVLLDWVLPRVSGLAVLEQIRETSHVPVLMMTARYDEMDRVTGLEWGADDYLVKPFGMRELVARIKALLRRSQFAEALIRRDRKTTSRLLIQGDLTFDPESHWARLKNRELSLTPLEFGLLGLFLAHPRQVYSRDYLLETLWRGVLAGCDRSVDNAVLRLRKKLKGWHGAIETVWGIGYRLNPEGGPTP